MVQSVIKKMYTFINSFHLASIIAAAVILE
jgi:hypothetical protein